MTRRELLSRAYQVIPAERIKEHLWERMKQIAPRFSHLGVTRIYPPVFSVRP
ncbi:MAG TPA: hypothetical protein VGC41_05020 [Kofleriaceae bacterium]